MRQQFNRAFSVLSVAISLRLSSCIPYRKFPRNFSLHRSNSVLSVMPTLIYKPVPQAVSTDPTKIPLSLVSLPEKLQVNVVCEPVASEDSLIFLTHSFNEDDPNHYEFNQGMKSHDDSFSCGWLQSKALQNEFSASAGSSICTEVDVNGKPEYRAILGLGKKSELSIGQCIKIGKDLAALLQKLNTTSATLVLPDKEEALNHHKLQKILEGFYMAAKTDNRFKSVKAKMSKDLKLSQLTLAIGRENMAEANNFAVAVEKAKQMALGMQTAAELVNAPANYCNPISLANAAVELGEKMGMDVKILDKEEIEKLKMGAYLAVAKGSMYEPRLIHLTYKGVSSKRSIALVGKGLCFDAGGYNIKSAASQIELMKFDMGGAAAVLGAAHTIGLLKPKNVTVHFIIAAAENMVSAEAYRPGDVITASNNKTIEVGNTDAEGRLTLADALIYAEDQKADEVVDIATLTGACVVGLGPSYAAVYSPRSEWAKRIVKLGTDAGDLLWHMPMAKEYRSFLDSKIADINNISTSSKGGGSITAALFLNEFVSDKVEWSHIDIAGPAWDHKEGTATGFGVRTLTELAMAYEEK